MGPKRDADDNSNLTRILEKEAGVALNWFKQNQMIDNPEKICCF